MFLEDIHNLEDLKRLRFLISTPVVYVLKYKNSGKYAQTNNFKTDAPRSELKYAMFIDTAEQATEVCNNFIPTLMRKEFPDMETPVVVHKVFTNILERDLI